MVVDRIIIKEEAKQRISASVETALNLSDGLIIVEEADNKNRRHTFHQNLPVLEWIYIEVNEPRIFSFNSPFGFVIFVGIGKSKSLTKI